MSEGAWAIITPGKTALNPCPTETVVPCSYKRETVGHLLRRRQRRLGGKLGLAKMMQSRNLPDRKGKKMMSSNELCGLESTRWAVMIWGLSLCRARKKEERAMEAPRRGDWQKHREIFPPLFKIAASLLSLLCAPHTSCFISIKYCHLMSLLPICLFVYVP